MDTNALYKHPVGVTRIEYYRAIRAKGAGLYITQGVLSEVDRHKDAPLRDFDAQVTL